MRPSSKTATRTPRYRIKRLIKKGRQLLPSLFEETEDAKRKRPAIACLFLLASPARFERAAFRLGGECSILLSYGDKVQAVLYLICAVLSIRMGKITR